MCTYRYTIRARVRVRAYISYILYVYLLTYQLGKKKIRQRATVKSIVAGKQRLASSTSTYCWPFARIFKTRLARPLSVAVHRIAPATSQLHATLHSQVSRVRSLHTCMYVLYVYLCTYVEYICTCMVRVGIRVYTRTIIN